MDTKSISYLKEKLWYRLLKVIYIFSFIYCILPLRQSLSQRTLPVVYTRQ